MFKSLVLAFRPKTLTAAVVPIFAASALSYRLDHSVNFFLMAMALFSSLCIQIATNLINDAKDFKKGADDHNRIGPTRVTQSGQMSYRQVMNFAYFFLILAGAFGLPLIYFGGKPILVIGLFSVFFAYSYTGGPYPLAYKGLGDLFVVLFFGLVAVGGAFFLNSGHYGFEAFWLGLQVGFLCAVLIAINNTRDLFLDQKVNKNTLAVRLGLKGARVEILLLLILPFLMNFYWIKYSILGTFLPFLILPLAVKIIFLVYRTEPSPAYNKFLAMSAAVHLVFSVLYSLGILI